MEQNGNITITDTKQVTPLPDVGRIIIVWPVRSPTRAYELRQAIVELLKDIPDAQLTFSIATVPVSLLPTKGMG